MTLRSPLLRLETGDHLDQREFHRRYEAMPHLKKAELLDGVVFVPSPTSVDHAAAHGIAAGWLAVYAAGTPGVQFLPEATVILGEDDEVQPDALLRISGPARRSRLSAGGYVEGPPELILEIAQSSASYDLHVKRAVYERAGVREYVVWRVADAEIDWWVLQQGRSDYAPVAPDRDGPLRSTILPGLLLDRAAALSGDLAGVLKAQRRALGSEAHRALVATLAS